MLSCCPSSVQKTLTDIRESLSSLVFQPLLKRKQLPGFLEEEVRYPKDSVASLAHLVFVHHLAADWFPGVFWYVGQHVVSVSKSLNFDSQNVVF